MNLKTKKPVTAIVGTVLLTSIAMLAIQAQNVEAGGLVLPDGTILVTLEDWGTGNPGLIQVDPSSGVQTFIDEFSDVVVDMKFTSNGDDLIVATEADILNYHTPTLVKTVLTSAGDDLLGSPVSIDLDAAGNILVLDDDGVGNGLIVSVDPVSGTETLVLSHSAIAGSQSLAVESSGDIIVLSSGVLNRVVPLAGTVTILSSDVLGGTEVVAINDAGDIFTAGTEVVKTDPITGTSTTISSGFTGILGIDIDDDGDVIVADSDADTIVYSVDPVSGAQTIVSSNDLFTGTTATSLTVKAGIGGGGVTATCQGVAATIVGTDGDDMLTGTDGDDVIDGGNGDDVINGLDGNDIICGGGGDDYIDAGNGNDSVRGNPGKDVILGGEGNDSIEGGTGKDNINGGSGNDEINGDEHDDIIIGGSEDDDMDGGPGVDLCETEVNDITADCETITSP